MDDALLSCVIMIGAFFVFLVSAILMVVFKAGDKEDEKYKKMTPEERKEHDADILHWMR